MLEMCRHLVISAFLICKFVQLAVISGVSMGDKEASPQVVRDDAARLPIGQSVVSPGDVVAYNDAYFLHRALAIAGLHGCPVRDLVQPQKLYGIHLGSASKPSRMRTDPGCVCEVSMSPCFGSSSRHES